MQRIPKSKLPIWSKPYRVLIGRLNVPLRIGNRDDSSVIAYADPPQFGGADEARHVFRIEPEHKRSGCLPARFTASGSTRIGHGFAASLETAERTTRKTQPPIVAFAIAI